MKKATSLFTGMVTIALLAACTQNEAKQENKDAAVSKTGNTEQSLFSKGAQGPAENFTGTAYVRGVVPKDSVQNSYSIGEVTFEPGARSNWHDHPAGQILMITSGNGFVQEKGKTAQPLKKGDLVVCQPNVDHWHGAAPNAEMSHIAITNYKGNVNVNWKNAVTDEEYKSATGQ